MKSDILRLIVNENPTTGYQWIFRTPEQRGINGPSAVYNITVDEYIEDKVHSNDGQHHLLGVGGVRVLELTAQNLGVDTFEMVYVRSFEIDPNSPVL